MNTARLSGFPRLIKSNYPFFILFGVIALLASPISKTESTPTSIPYSTQHIQDATIELGETQIRIPGTNGEAIEKKRVIKPLLSHISGLSYTYNSTDLPRETIARPTNEVVADGTKKYQYMHCSDGSYRYYTNEQFVNPTTGFTHKSPDACQKNGNGHMTSLSDSAPQKQAVQQTTRTVYTPSYTPTYTAPTYTSPTHCYTRYNTYGGYFDPTANTTCY